MVSAPAAGSSIRTSCRLDPFGRARRPGLTGGRRCAGPILSPGRTPMPAAPRRKSLVGPRAGNYSERRAASDSGRAPPHEDVDATGPPHESSRQTLPGQTQTMIPPRRWWWFPDRRRCAVKKASPLRRTNRGLLPAPDQLGADFPSYRPTIGEPDTPAWQELCRAPVEEALISLGVPGYLRPQEALKL